MLKKGSFKRKLFLLLLLLNVSVLSSSCDLFTKKDMVQKRFDRFTNEVFVTEVSSDTLSINYMLANPEKYGVKNTETTLGEYSTDQMKEDLTASENCLSRLKHFDYKALTPKQQLTYDILKNSLKLGLEAGNYLYYNECLGPTTGIQAQLPILLAEYNFYGRDDIDRYIELLPCVYGYFKEIAEFEREKSAKGLFMNDDVADSIIEQCETFIDDPENNFLIKYFNTKITGYQGLSSEEIKDYKVKNEAGILQYVIPAYRLLIDTLKELKGTGINEAGLYYYPEGQAYYDYLARLKTGSGRDTEGMADMLDTAIGDDVLELTKISLSDSAIIDKYEHFTSFPITDPDAILSDLKKDISKDFPEPVSVNCDIKYVDESLSDYLSPAMYLVPAIDNYTDNNIYINGNDSETLAKIYTTVAHEGYPGHLYQCVYFRNQNPAPIRSLLDFLGYDEGWATYVELYSYRFSGIDKSLADFLRINNEIILFMYARADIGINYEGWSKSKAVSYMNNFTGDKKVSESIYDTLLEEPAIYLPYAIGYLEILELKDKAQTALGDRFNLKDFHQFILDIGPAQFEVIKDRINEWIEDYPAYLYQTQ